MVMVFILDAGQVYLIYIFESRLPKNNSILVWWNWTQQQGLTLVVVRKPQTSKGLVRASEWCMLLVRWDKWTKYIKMLKLRKQVVLLSILFIIDIVDCTYSNIVSDILLDQSEFVFKKWSLSCFMNKINFDKYFLLSDN